MNTSNRFDAPWEAYFDQVLHPIEEFIHYKSSSGILLFICAVVSFILINSPLHDQYEKLLKSELTFIGADIFLHMTVHQWINDGLMTIFFLLMGLEIKRELLVGELSRPRKALLPAAAALGGMAVPALLYLFINPALPDSRGWGVPMATDIAFAVGVLTLLGNRIPHTLFVFLISLAIVDDIGAVIVIALYYSGGISTTFLALAGIVFCLLVFFNYIGIRNLLPYSIGGIFLWLAVLQSGFHATIAGVILASTIPVRPRTEPEQFSHLVRGLLDQFDGAADESEDILINNEQRAIIVSLMEGARHTLTPLQRMEHSLHLPVSFFIMPLFALANAGLPLDMPLLEKAVFHPIAIGITIGLLAGKVTGVCGASLLVIKLGWADLPKGTDYRQLAGIGLLAGIGFTMSIFIAELAFISADNLNLAKIGVLAGSSMAATLGVVVLTTPAKTVSATQN